MRGRGLGVGGGGGEESPGTHIRKMQTACFTKNDALWRMNWLRIYAMMSSLHTLALAGLRAKT